MMGWSFRCDRCGEKQSHPSASITVKSIELTMELCATCVNSLAVWFSRIDGGQQTLFAETMERFISPSLD